MSPRWLLIPVALATSLVAACGGGSNPKRDGGEDASGGTGGAPTDASDAGVDQTTDTADDNADAVDGATDTAADSVDADNDSGSDAPAPTSNCAVAGSLLVDCGFELPVVTDGTFLTFSVGQPLGGWMVVGPDGGNVAVLSGTFQQNGLSFPAHEGKQTLDMTGLGSNSATGVTQAVTTAAGARYDLSFWVGNLVNGDGVFGISSKVLVFVDGTQILAAQNDDGTGAVTLAWKKFSTSFVAAGASTTVEFRNADPANDNSNILDDIVLVKE